MSTGRNAETDAPTYTREDLTVFDVLVWPPEEWCAAVNPQRTHICDQPRGHDGDHQGPLMPTVEVDE